MLCTALTFVAGAQQNTFQFDAIDSRMGLSNNQVNTVFKDEKGFVWFGTMAGLNRYDGYSFKIFRHKAGDSTSINDDYVSHVMQGPNRKLWVYTPSGWNIFDPLSEKFTTNIGSIIDTHQQRNNNLCCARQDG